MWLRYLDQSEIEMIHYASLKILEEEGALVLEHDFLKFLAKVGAAVDYDRKRARLP